ncbi:MAG: CHAT domain-containing protein, partial [Candidatus Rhabdochlamydia sp.]
DAITYHEKALKLALELKDEVFERKIYADLGNAYEGLGKYEDAITYHEKALKLALELKDWVSEGKIYAGLGNAYSGHGDYRSAITYHEKALKLALKLKDLVIEGKVYGNLGNAYQGLGDYKSAITYQEKHLKIALKLNDWADIKNAHGNLGNAYNGLGDYKGAIAYYEKHLKIALELKDLASEGRAYCNLGSAYSGLGDYKGAIAYYERRLKIALELNDRVSEGRIYGNLGSAYDGLEDYKGAITYQKKALEIALKQKDLVGEGHTYGNLGNTYLKLREENKAERYFQQSIKILASFHHQIQDPKWQISFFEEQSFSYIGLEKALLGQNKLDQALEASDMRRARALSSLISRHPSSAAHQKTSLGTLTIQTIRDLAKKFHTTFIMYSSSSGNQSNPSLQAWVISSESEKVSSVSFSISDQIFLNPEQIFNAFPYLKETKRPQRREKQPGEAFKEKLSSFYTCLIAPLEQYLPLKDSGETLTFILDGFLAHLPFGAFYNKDEDKYLIENYPISVAPSIEALYLLDELPKNSSQEALLMGNPTTPKKELNELKLAEKEVCIIVAPMLGLSQDEVFIQEKATPMCVVDKAPHARIIHIACHGVIYQKLFEKHDPNSVFEGLFKLAPDEKHSMGHLHAKEIAEMSLKADLVFMSACHLGRGNLKEEGSVGPVWSFLGAGAKSTIASYWPLPEGDMTVKMVETFYKHYLGINTPKLNKSKALQQAILMAMKIDRDKPRQWGAFFLSGIIE